MERNRASALEIIGIVVSFIVSTIFFVVFPFDDAWNGHHAINYSIAYLAMAVIIWLLIKFTSFRKDGINLQKSKYGLVLILIYAGFFLAIFIIRQINP